MNNDYQNQLAIWATIKLTIKQKVAPDTKRCLDEGRQGTEPRGCLCGGMGGEWVEWESTQSEEEWWVS